MSNFLRSGRPIGEVKAKFIFALALICLIPNFVPNLHAQNAPKVRRKVLTMVEPEYPAILKEGHFQGQVRLAATVQANGNVSKVEIRGGNPMLSEYAAGPADTVEDVVFNFNGNQ
jgi:Gram-negative bacterial TonB protein C-terminal